jgi:murein DD-endopeptidase MepM/ murein hydrolase activator NlpD
MNPGSKSVHFLLPISFVFLASVITISESISLREFIHLAVCYYKSKSHKKGARSVKVKSGVQYKQVDGRWIPVLQRPPSIEVYETLNNQDVKPDANFFFQWPLDPGFIVTQTFQEHLQYKLEHNLKYYNGGLDLAYSDIREGANVYAAADGILKKASYSPEGYGNVVYIDHLNGFVSIYAHLSGFAGILVGNIVTAGDVVGYLGHSGNCRGGPGNPDGTHLHFEVRYQGVPVDSAGYLP